MLPRIEPDRAALEVAHRILHTPLSIEQMLASRPLALILQNVARRHMHRCQAYDAKRLQANDHE